ncbi:hypothetical protein [Oceanivirga salmonicida]|uniref:hypothetical protein n=1 Tax=Oceanivirga salmonicida TaxID=1769291 RepID=UPI00083448DF|nr:hypothetical protein [Oceanivirga salmonicida]
MKKILLTIAMIASAFSMAKGVTTVSGGAGVFGDKEYTNGYAVIDARHLVPIHKINDKLSVLAGGGGDFKFIFPKKVSLNGGTATTFFMFLEPYGTAQLKYMVNPDLNLRVGAKTGLDMILAGTHLKAPGVTSFTLTTHWGIPMHAVLGLDYKNVSFDLEAGGSIFLQKEFGGAYNVGLNIGYSF